MADRDGADRDGADKARIGRRAALSLVALTAPAAASARLRPAPSGAGEDRAVAAAASRAAAARSAPGADCVAMLLAGYAAPGDGGGGRYVRVAAHPAHQAAFQTADGAWYAIDEPIVGPRHFGASGRGEGDDAAAFQAMIDAVIGGPLRARLHIAGGLYRIATKLQLPLRALAGAIDGDGMLAAPFYRHRTINNATALAWSGPGGGTLIGGLGVGGLSLRDITLLGALAPDAPRAAILFHCEQDRTNGAGSGAGLMEQVSFFDADVAIRMGAAIDDQNCADWTFVRVGFGHCGIGLQVVNRQGLNYTMTAPSAVACGSLVRMDHGGHFYATNVELSSSGGIGDDLWLLDFRALGDNADMVVIDGLRLENGCRQTLRATGGIVQLRAYEEAQTPQPCTMVELYGTTLSVDGARLVSCSAATPHFRLMRRVTGGRTVLHLRNVHFAVPRFRLEEWVFREPGADAILTMTGCTYGKYGDPVPIAATNNVLTEGAVTLIGSSDGGGPSLLSIDGKAAIGVGDGGMLPAGGEALVTASVFGRRSDGSGDPVVAELRALVGPAPRRIVAPLAAGGRASAGLAIVAIGDHVMVRVDGGEAAAMHWTATLTAAILPERG